jgi:hypothetical protein
LRKLQLTAFSSLPAGRFTNLTPLSLDWQRNREISGIEFLNVLQASPTLEDLSVERHGPIGEDVCHGRLIYLPCLKTLALDSCNFDFILTHVVFPQIREIYLYDSLYYMVLLPGFEFGAENVLIGIPQEFLHDLIPKVIDSLSVQYRPEELDAEVRHSQLFLKINQTFNYPGVEDTLRKAFPFVRRSLLPIRSHSLLFPYYQFVVVVFIVTKTYFLRSFGTRGFPDWTGWSDSSCDGF